MKNKAFFSSLRAGCIMDLIPFYSSLRLCGHLSCAYVAAVVCGTALFLATAFMDKGGMFERSYTFALVTGSAIWVLPVLVKLSDQAQQISVCAILALSLMSVRYAFGKPAKQSAVLCAVFIAAQAVVFYMVYKRIL